MRTPDSIAIAAVKGQAGICNAINISCEIEYIQLTSCGFGWSCIQLNLEKKIAILSLEDFDADLKAAVRIVRILQSDTYLEMVSEKAKATQRY